MAKNNLIRCAAIVLIAAFSISMSRNYVFAANYDATGTTVSTVYTITVEYKDSTGKTHTTAETTGREYTIGEKVDVLYDEVYPERSVLKWSEGGITRDGVWETVLGAICSFGLLVFSVLLFFRAFLGK